MPCNNEKMINYDEMTNEKNKKHNPNCGKCLVHALTSLLIGASRLGKTHTLTKFIQSPAWYWQHFLSAKDIYKLKYQLLINKHEQTSLKHCNYPKALIEY